MESDGRVWEQYDTLDATGEPASIRGIGLSSTSSRSPQSMQSPPVRGRLGGFDGNGSRSSPAAFTVSFRAHKTGSLFRVCFNIFNVGSCSSFLLPFLACYCGDGFPRARTYRSIGGLVRSATRIVLPIRGHLDSIKQLKPGDIYVGRGSRQRNLKKSPRCNPFKVSEHGRALAVSKFEHHLSTDQDLNEALWQLSGARLVCHCRPGEECHADIIRTVFRAHDRDEVYAKPPSAQVLNYMAKLREVPEHE